MPFPPPRDNGVRIVMTTCWRRLCSNIVDFNDQLGLCENCKDLLRDDGFVRELAPVEVEGGAAR